MGFGERKELSAAEQLSKGRPLNGGGTGDRALGRFKGG
jgi:hypothetical protein